MSKEWWEDEQEAYNKWWEKVEPYKWQYNLRMAFDAGYKAATEDKK